MKYWFITILGILTFSLTSCEKEAINIKTPKVDPKLVIQSFISPQDTTIVVRVSYSQPVFGDPSSYYINPERVTVNLSDGTNSINLTYTDFSTGYEKAFMVDAEEFPIIAGKTYYLKVTDPNGKVAEASCTVPQDAPIINNFKLDSTDITQSHGDYSWTGRIYKASFNFNDDIGQQKYYRLRGFIKTEYESSWDDDVHVHVQEQEVHLYNYDLFTSDKTKGSQISISDLEIYRRSLDSYGSSNITSFELMLFQTDKHYYEYHRTINLSYNDNPFAEPVIVYSNVTGGLGVFSAYNRSSLKVDFN